MPSHSAATAFQPDFSEREPETQRHPDQPVSTVEDDHDVAPSVAGSLSFMRRIAIIAGLGVIAWAPFVTLYLVQR